MFQSHNLLWAHCNLQACRCSEMPHAYPDEKAKSKRHNFSVPSGSCKLKSIFANFNQFLKTSIFVNFKTFLQASINYCKLQLIFATSIEFANFKIFLQTSINFCKLGYSEILPCTALCYDRITQCVFQILGSLRKKKVGLHMHQL